jgi:hypothetical protein
MRWLRLTQTLTAIGIALVILMFFEIALLVALIGGTTTIKAGGQTRAVSETETTLILLLFAVMAIVSGEAARRWIRQTFALDESKFSARPRGVASTLGGLALLRDLIFAPLLPIIAFAANVLILFLLTREITSRGFALPTQFWLVLGLYVVYLPARQPILAVLRRASRPVTRPFTSAVPTFTRKGNAIILDLKRRRARPPSQRGLIGIASEPCIVTIRFDELDEIRAFSYVEAQSFVQYELGPDLQLGLKGSTELYRYLNGEIERPSVYGYYWGSLGTVLLLRGPQLFYLISVANADVNELVAAFNAYKQSAARAVSAAG